MPMYALGILPLIQRLSTAAKQVWFADDGTAGGKLDQIRLWWSLLNTIGPEYGYNPNAAKSWLIVKDRGALRGSRKTICRNWDECDDGGETTSRGCRGD